MAFLFSLLSLCNFSYMHSSCLPPIAHSNLKAANILLDEELMPHISDCSLAILRPLTSNSVKLKVHINMLISIILQSYFQNIVFDNFKHCIASKPNITQASEMAIADSGYIVPENFQPMQPGIANTKADVYAFGVLLLELLTGRRPFDWYRVYEDFLLPSLYSTINSFLTS